MSRWSVERDVFPAAARPHFGRLGQWHGCPSAGLLSERWCEVRPVAPEPVLVPLHELPGRTLPGKSWPVVSYGFDPIDGYTASGNPSDDDLLAQRGFVVDADGMVAVLPLDGEA